MNDEIEQHEDQPTEINNQEPVVEESKEVTSTVKVDPTPQVVQAPVAQPTTQVDQGHTITQVSNSRFEVTIAGHTFSIKREGGTYLWGSHFASSLEHLIEKLKSRM